MNNKEWFPYMPVGEAKKEEQYVHTVWLLYRDWKVFRVFSTYEAAEKRMDENEECVWHIEEWLMDAL